MYLCGIHSCRSSGGDGLLDSVDEIDELEERAVVLCCVIIPPAY